jgi:hypothetical protein
VGMGRLAIVMNRERPAGISRRQRATLVGAVLALLAMTTGAVAAVEATKTPVDVRLVFGQGCFGSGVLTIRDPEGRPWITRDGGTVARLRRAVAWRPGSALHVEGDFAGAASPQLRLVDDGGSALVEIDLVPWGGRAEGPSRDHYAVRCDGTNYSVLPNTGMPSPGLPAVASVVGALLAVVGLAAIVITRVAPRRTR